MINWGLHALKCSIWKHLELSWKKIKNEAIVEVFCVDYFNEMKKVQELWGNCMRLEGFIIYFFLYVVNIYDTNEEFSNIIEIKVWEWSLHRESCQALNRCHTSRGTISLPMDKHIAGILFIVEELITYFMPFTRLDYCKIVLDPDEYLQWSFIRSCALQLASLRFAWRMYNILALYKIICGFLMIFWLVLRDLIMTCLALIIV